MCTDICGPLNYPEGFRDPLAFSSRSRFVVGCTATYFGADVHTLRGRIIISLVKNLNFSPILRSLTKIPVNLKAIPSSSVALCFQCQLALVNMLTP